MDDAGRARLRADRIGIVLQSGNLIPFLTASENLELAARFAGGDDAAEREASWRSSASPIGPITYPVG